MSEVRSLIVRRRGRGAAECGGRGQWQRGVGKIGGDRYCPYLGCGDASMDGYVFQNFSNHTLQIGTVHFMLMLSQQSCFKIKQRWGGKINQVQMRNVCTGGKESKRKRIQSGSSPLFPDAHTCPECACPVYPPDKRLTYSKSNLDVIFL